MAKRQIAKTGETEQPITTRPLDPFEEMERLFDETLPSRWMNRWGWPSLSSGFGRSLESYSPRVNVIDRDDEIALYAEVPGFKKDELDISVTENAVTIKGSSRSEQKEERGDYYRCEISHGSFTRTVGLPGTVDTEKAKASFKDGVLELTMPKLSKAKRRHIEVS